MEKSQIHRLLEKYFEGNTTLEEDMILRNHFLSDNIKDPGEKLISRQFKLLEAGRNTGSESGIPEAGIINAIEAYEQQHNPPVKKLPVARYLVAASIVLAIMFSTIFLLRSRKSGISDTFTDPQLAYAETQKTLLFISQKINDGMKPLDNINKMNDATDQLRNLEKMDKSLGMLNLVSFINQSSNLKK